MRERLVNDLHAATENGTTVVVNYSFGNSSQNGMVVDVIPDHCEDGNDEIIIISGSYSFEISLDGTITYDEDLGYYFIENENYIIGVAA